MGSGCSHTITSGNEYNEESIKKQSYNRNKVLNQIKKQHLTLRLPKDKEQKDNMIYTPIVYNKYRRQQK
jgi:hypothetical protein